MLANISTMYHHYRLHGLILCCITLLLITVETTFQEKIPEIPQQDDEKAAELTREDQENEEQGDIMAINCKCQDKANKALVESLQSCTDALAAIQSCATPRKQPKRSQRALTSCRCGKKVTAALTKALQSCSDALTNSAGCSRPGKPPTKPKPPVLKPKPPTKPKPPVKPPVKSAASCQEIKKRKPSSASGYYTLAVNGRKLRRYCYFGKLCGRNGGWMRLGGRRRTSRKCPRSLRLKVAGGKRICARRSSGCSSVRFPSKGIKYSQICGRVSGYGYYSTDGISRFPHNKPFGINRPYVDGVSITRGYPRKHVWTFISGGREGGTSVYDCPCNRGVKQPRFPSFVGSDWYCESVPNHYKRFYTADALWDRKLCRSREVSCCRKERYLPWFKKSLSALTSDYLEMRLCCDEGAGNENIAVGEYAFYVM